jgi:hypothetical protein
MSWKTIIKQPQLEETGQADDVSGTVVSGPDRGELAQAGVRVSVGTYADLLDEIGQLWVQAKTANTMEQKTLLGQMRKKIREKNIPEA